MATEYKDQEVYDINAGKYKPGDKLDRKYLYDDYKREILINKSDRMPALLGYFNDITRLLLEVDIRNIFSQLVADGVLMKMGVRIIEGYKVADGILREHGKYSFKPMNDQIYEIYYNDSSLGVYKKVIVSPTIGTIDIVYPIGNKAGVNAVVAGLGIVVSRSGDILKDIISQIKASSASESEKYRTYLRILFCMLFHYENPNYGFASLFTYWMLYNFANEQQYAASMTSTHIIKRDEYKMMSYLYGVNIVINNTSGSSPSVDTYTTGDYDPARTVFIETAYGQLAYLFVRADVPV